MATATSSLDTLADLVSRLGGVSLERIRFRPAPGNATIQDVLDIQEREGKLCELVEGSLVEKIMGQTESLLALWIGTLLNNFVRPRNLGIVLGADGLVKLMPDLVRIPDVAFTSWDRFPGRRRPADRILPVAPSLAVEVLSIGNPADEMAGKRQDYFAACVELVWEVNPRSRTVAVYTTPTDFVTLTVADVLDGGTVLPGFTVPVLDLFDELDRHG